MANTKRSTKDQYPQFLRGQKTESAANTYGEAEILCPCPVNLPNGNILVMNILRIFIDPDFGEGGDADEVRCELKNKSGAALSGYDDAGVLAYYNHHSELTTSGEIILSQPKIYDLSDGNGHGVLYAKSKMYFAVHGASQSNPISARFALLYTLVEIDPREFIGIVEGE